ncbi:MAG: hypothetical protein SNJ77_12420 [Cytophagales bacterium]
MKKILLMLLLSFGLVLFAQNQGGKKPKGKPTQSEKGNKGENGKKGDKPNIEERAEKTSQRWMKELSLSEDERLAFKKAKIAQLEKKSSAIENSKSDRKQLGAEMKKINTEFRESVKASWSETKYNQWVEKKKEMAKKGKEMKAKKKSVNSDTTPKEDLLDEEDDGIE